MQNNIQAVLMNIKRKCNPLMIADEISHFIIESLANKTIHLYEAYLLNMEVIRFKRLSYLQPAWNGKVQISTCLALINQKMLADLFGDIEGASLLKQFAHEAVRINIENRHHYVMERFSEFLEANSSPQLLAEMLKLRQNYQELNDDDGPFLNELFPYHFFCVEEVLLDEDAKKRYLSSKELREEIQELIVELNILDI